MLSGMSDLDRFTAARGDDERLALGLGVLEAALSEARESGNLGWAEEINEYVHAIRTGTGLNRPLSDGKDDSHA